MAHRFIEMTVINKDQKDLQLWFKHCKGSLSKGFMMIVRISYNGKLKIRNVDKNVKISSNYHLLTLLV